MGLFTSLSSDPQRSPQLAARFGTGSFLMSQTTLVNNTHRLSAWGVLSHLAVQ
jgi:hypothetical protein